MSLRILKVQRLAWIARSWSWWYDAIAELAISAKFRALISGNSSVGSDSSERPARGLAKTIPGTT